MTAQSGAHRPIRVLHLIDNLSSRGGAQQSIVALAPGIVANGVDFSLATLGEGDELVRTLREQGIHVTELEGRGGRAVDVVRVVRLLRSQRPDLLHTSLHGANVVGRIAGHLTRVPVVASMVSTHHGAAHMARSSLWGRVKAAVSTFFDRRSMRSTVRVHAVSESVATEIERHFRVPRGHIEVIARGRDPRLFGARDAARRAEVRTSLGLSSTAPVVLAVGRQHPVKGYDVLLDAVPTLRAAHAGLRVLIAGEDEKATPALRAQVERLGVADAVVFLGHRDDIPGLHQAADVFVLASRVEGMPGALIEALAMGTPVVSTNIGPALEVVDESCAVIVPVGSAEAIAAAVTDVLCDDEATAARVERGRLRFDERFRLDTVSRQMAEFYIRALS